MDLDRLSLKAIIRHAERMPKQLLGDLGQLADLCLAMRGVSNWCVHCALDLMFSGDATAHERGMNELLSVPGLDKDWAAAVIHDANRLLSNVSYEQRENIRKLLIALQTSGLAEYFYHFVDPAEPEGYMILTSVSKLTAFLEGGFVSSLIARECESQSFSPVLKPRWDADSGELCFGTILIKKYKDQAENQRIILDSFEELGWKKRIDDPIPGQRWNARRRRRDAITGLNNDHIIPGIIRFRGDGSGNGIIWERCK